MHPSTVKRWVQTTSQIRNTQINPFCVCVWFIMANVAGRRNAALQLNIVGLLDRTRAPKDMTSQGRDDVSAVMRAELKETVGYAIFV